MNVREKTDRWRVDADGLENRPAPVGVVQTCIHRGRKSSCQTSPSTDRRQTTSGASVGGASEIEIPIVRRDDCIGESVYDEKLAVLLGNDLLNLKCGDGRLEVRANPRAEPREP
jgi:hypothetical protein